MVLPVGIIPLGAVSAGIQTSKKIEEQKIASSTPSDYTPITSVAAAAQSGLSPVMMVVSAGITLSKSPPPKPIVYNKSEYKELLSSEGYKLKDFDPTVPVPLTFKQKKDMRAEGERLIAFDPSAPVEYEGKLYPGSDMIYTVGEGDEAKQYSASEYDKYLDQVGRGLVSQAESGVVPGKDMIYTVETESGVKTMSASEYDAYLEKQGDAILSKASGVDKWYEGSTVTLYPVGSQITKTGYKNPSLSDWAGAIIWDWDTAASYVSKGKSYKYKESVKEPVFVFDYKVKGGENYKYYESKIKSDPLLAATLGWGWGGLANTDILVYDIMGQHDKAVEKQVGQLAGYDQAKKTLAAGDIVGFSGQYWSGYLSMPSTQIGLAVAGSNVASSVAPRLAGASTATRLGLKTGKVVMGGLLVKYVSDPVVDYQNFKLKDNPDVGTFVGRLNVTALAIGSAGAVYESSTHGSRYNQIMNKQPSASFTKEFVKGFPRVYNLMQQKLPGLRPIFGEAGFGGTEGVLSRPVGFPNRFSQFLYRGYTNIGNTGFARNIYGWAAKGYLPATTYVMKQEPVSYGIFGRKSGEFWVKDTSVGFWNRRSWVSPDKLSSFRSYVGDSGQIKIDFPSSRYMSGGDVKITGVIEGKSVRFNRSSFSVRRVTSVSEREYTLPGFEVGSSNIDMVGALGSMEPGSTTPGIFNVKNYGVPQKPPSYLGELVETGYWTKATPPSIVKTWWGGTKTIAGSPSEFIPGFGSTNQVITPKSPTQWIKSIPSSIMKNVEAAASLVSPRSLSSNVSLYGGGSGSLSSVHARSIQVPSVFSLPSVSYIPIHGQSSVISTVESSLVSNIQSPVVSQIKTPTISQISIPTSSLIRVPTTSLVELPVVSQVRVPAVKQTQVLAQSLIQIPLLKTVTTKTPTIRTPVIKTPRIVTPMVFPPLGGGGYMGGNVSRNRLRGLGYRFRSWRVPTMRSLFPGYKNFMEDFDKKVKW